MFPTLSNTETIIWTAFVLSSAVDMNVFYILLLGNDLSFYHIIKSFNNLKKKALENIFTLCFLTYLRQKLSFRLSYNDFYFVVCFKFRGVLRGSVVRCLTHNLGVLGTSPAVSIGFFL